MSALAAVLLAAAVSGEPTPSPTPGPLDRGEKLLAARQYDKAIVQLRLAIAADPESARAQGDLALALLAQHKTREAVDAGRLAAAFGRETPEARYIFGLALMADGRPVEAARELEKAAALKPGEIAPVMALAAAYAAAEDERTVATYEKLLEARPADPKVRADFAEYLWRTEKTDEGNRVMERALVAFPTNTALLRSHGRALLQQERPVDAARALEKARSLGSRDVATFAMLADAYEQTDQADTARAVLAAGIEGNPSDAALRQDLGRLLLAAGKSDEALKELQEAARLDPKAVETQLDLGRALEGVGRPSEAEAAYRRAIQLAPNVPRSHYALGRLLQREGQAAEAQSELDLHRRLYERGREAVSLHEVQASELAYAWAEWHEGNTAAALARFEALAETTETLRGRALALSRLRRHAEAVAVLERARTLAPDDNRIELLLVTERASAREAE